MKAIPQVGYNNPVFLSLAKQSTRRNGHGQVYKNDIGSQAFFTLQKERGSHRDGCTQAVDSHRNLGQQQDRTYMGNAI
jgi:hypothetical protein